MRALLSVALRDHSGISQAQTPALPSMSSLRSSGRTRAALLAVVGASTLAVHAAGAQTERRSLNGSRVALYNVAGEVRVERGRGRDVEFEVTRSGPDASKLRVETGSVRGVPTLRVIYPDDDVVYRGPRDDARSGSRNDSRDDRWYDRGRWSNNRTETRIRDDGTWGGDWGRDSWGGRRMRVTSNGRGLEAWADIRVFVPDGQQFDAYLLVGLLTAADVDGSLKLDVGAARVRAERTRGSLDIDAGSGGVEVRNAQATLLKVDNGSGGVQMDDVRADDCDVDSGSGGLTGRGVSCRRFNLDIGSGGVRIEDASMDDVNIDTGSGGIALTLRNSPRRLSASAGSGSVTLGLPASLDATLDIETGSGSITTDFAVRTNRVERNSLRGTVGDGRNSVRVETGSGSVRLRRATP